MNWPLFSPAQNLSLMVGQVVEGDLVIKESLVLLHLHTYTCPHMQRRLRGPQRAPPSDAGLFVFDCMPLLLTIS